MRLQDLDPREAATLFLRTVTVGPFPIYFGNVNVAMNLPGHHHTAAITLVYETESNHGYPSFQATNDLIRGRLADHTGKRNTFRDATNEDVADRLWDLFDGWVPDPWLRWGGSYRLWALYLDVEGVHDDIGHDAGVTRYSIERRDNQLIDTPMRRRYDYGDSQ